MKLDEKTFSGKMLIIAYFLYEFVRGVFHFFWRHILIVIIILAVVFGIIRMM